jgi:IclR family transcriptional regulator, acetate operon repressor
VLQSVPADVPADTADVRAGSRVQSVERAATVLDVLIGAEHAMTALELSRETRINRTNVHRLLRTMQGTGLVQERSPGHYGLGPATLLLGNAYAERLPVRRLALPYLVDLSNRVIRDRPWVAALAVPIGTDAVLIDRIWQPNAPLDSILDVGTRLPFARSAHGRAMLSTFSPDAVPTVIGAENGARLADELHACRQHGNVASSQDEFRPGIGAVAAAIVDRRHELVGSIAVSGLHLDNELDLDSEVARHLRRVAKVITGVLP